MQRHTLVITLLFGLPAGLAAQVPVPVPPPLTAEAPVSVTGSISSGLSQIQIDTKSSKFTEYRDLADRAFVPRLTLNVLDSRDGRYADFGGTNITLRDQSLFARGGVAGVWRAGVDWNSILHNFSNRAQTPYIQRTRSLFEVPATIPIPFRRLATVAADAPNVLASDVVIAAYQQNFLQATPLETDTNVGRVFFGYNGWDALTAGASYSRRGQVGLESTFAPMGDRPPRTLNIQMTEPVDTLIQELTLSAERVTNNYVLQFNYMFSDFANNVDTLVWENVYTSAATDATYDTWDRAISTFGRRPLEPDNRYHNISATVGRDLVLDSRLTATVAYGRLEQNEALLPYSYHTDFIATSALPRGTAMASMDTVQLLVDYAINPRPRLNIRAWTRYYGLNNHTPHANWQYVTSDTSNLNRTVSYKNKRVNLAYATDRTNAGAEATYRLRPWRSSFGLRYELEAAGRDYREADTTENRIGLTYRARPMRGVNLHGRYIFGVRNGTYDPFVTRESYWYAPNEADADDPQFTFSNHPDMRRHDVSDRRRNQADLTLTLAPGDMFSLSGSVRYRGDDFTSGVTPIQPLAGTGFPAQDAFTPGTQLGLLDDRRVRYSLDGFFMPRDRVSFNAFASLDNGRQLQRGLEFNENNKQNPAVVETAELGPWTRASSQWTSDTDDRIVTTGLGGNFTIIENRLMLNASYTLSAANVDIDYAGFGATNWTGVPFPPNHQFAFSSPPRVNHDWHVLDFRAEMPLLQRTVFTIGYSYERYRIDDWQEAGEGPWVEQVGSEFLLRDSSRSHQWGNRLFNLGTLLAPSYNAHFAYASFTYRF